MSGAGVARAGVGRGARRSGSPRTSSASSRRWSRSPRPPGDVAAAEEICALVAALLPDEADGRAPALLDARLRARPARDARGDAAAAACCCSATSTRSSPTPSTGRSSRDGGAAGRLGRGRHEGRDRARARRDARAGGGARELRRARACSRSSTRSGAPAASRTRPRFAGYDACLCFEAGQLGPDGEEAVVAKRKAAATLRVLARGRRRALGLGAGEGPQRAARARRGGPAGRRRLATRPGRDRLTAVADRDPRRRRVQRRPRRRASSSATCAASGSRRSRPVLDAGPAERRRGRARGRARPALAGDGLAASGRRAARRAGARAARPSADASAGAAAPATPATWPRRSPLTVDGLGPRGGHAHHPDEFVARRLGPAAGRDRARGHRRGARRG